MSVAARQEADGQSLREMAVNIAHFTAEDRFGKRILAEWCRREAGA